MNLEIEIKRLPELIEKLRALAQKTNEAAQALMTKREEQRKFALAALDDAKKALTQGCDCVLCSGKNAKDALLAINEAIEQLEGRATP